ncbi:hypothetical protein COU20_02840 [Candidatus Kaiserbacteria bacterium CG10_big_fil_rev_8_21_14_0_10_59_10]|uniref:Glycosyltransferase RgtA/B/C/D-like domain-containing protein n=1 Tax=Candidatus Kaiserbacteria bacterium CG10_big_fil_rev_8_21_14_0_10_59_10 TaxID=1974612 RepID=A0A2H0U9H4_9BACT|nr:MAG: hypothetical protein COU20_02840 [Candidatus Kaiserbacteria bacterium CG10_big_fil_rev_8_21_14_0_10_59_10]
MALYQSREAGHGGMFDALILIGLLSFVTALSLLFFADQSLRLDEAQSLWQTSRSPGAILSTVAADVHVPLHHLLLHFWRLLFGEGVEVARALSLILYLFNIPALYLLGRLAYSRSVGIFAATLFAISPFMNWYANEIRMYTLFALLATLNQYFFMRVFKLKDTLAWTPYVFTAILGVFTHYFFFLNLAAQGAFYALYRHLFPNGSRTHLIGTAALIFALFTPWVLYTLLLGEAVYQQPALSSPTTVDFFNTLAEFIFGFQGAQLNTVIVSLWPIALIVAFLALRKNVSLSNESAYFLLILLFSLGTAFVFSVLVRPVFLSRYLIFTIPALYLLLSALLSVYPRPLSRIAKEVTVALMLIALAASALRGASVEEEYRAASAYLAQHAQAHDVIILSPPFTLYPVEYYYRGLAPITTLPQWDRYVAGPIPSFSAETLEEDVAALTESYERVWIVLSFDQGYEEDLRLYFEENYHRIERLDFPSDITILLYRLRYDTQNARAAAM